MKKGYPSTRYFCEYHFPLIEWCKGIDFLGDILTKVQERAHTLDQLYQYNCQQLLFPKPTLSTNRTFTFWVVKSICDSVRSLPGIFGGSLVTDNYPRNTDSSMYKGKKTSPRPRRILLDISVDNSEIANNLRNLGLEVERIWDYVADLIQYEIIDVCTTQYIDLLVTINDRLMTSSEEWLEYLMPHRTRLCIASPHLIDNPEELTSHIYQRVHTKRKYKTKNQPIYLRGKSN